MVMVPASGSVRMRIASSPPLATSCGSVTLKKRSLSNASLALLRGTGSGGKGGEGSDNGRGHDTMDERLIFGREYARAGYTEEE